jgi:hypothetical protein
VPITCADVDVLRGRLHFPSRGTWFAELKLDTQTLPSGLVTIAAPGGWTLKGTIVEPSALQLDSAHVRVAGGAGGLGTGIAAAPAFFSNAFVSDPLDAILGVAGETLSPTVDAGLTGVSLEKWTVTATSTPAALDQLCAAAGAALGKAITWRVLGDGTVWIGEDTWPAASLPDGSDVLDYFPLERRYLIGAETPTLLPGVTLSDIGAAVVGVDAWLEPHEVREWAWI